MSDEDIKLIEQFLKNIAKTKVDRNNLEQCYFDLYSLTGVAKAILMHLEDVSGNVDDYEVK